MMVLLNLVILVVMMMMLMIMTTVDEKSCVNSVPVFIRVIFVDGFDDFETM